MLCERTDKDMATTAKVGYFGKKVDLDIDEFHDKLTIDWKINILGHKSREFCFRESKFTLVFQPKICNSIIYMFLYNKSASGVYEVKAQIVDKNGKQLCENSYKGGLAHGPVIWSMDREELINQTDIFISDKVLIFHCTIEREDIDESQKYSWGGDYSPFEKINVNKNEVLSEVHQESLLEKLSMDYSKLLNCKDNSDVVLRSGEKLINAHKHILSVRSDVFEAMFRNQMSECTSGVVDITDIMPSVLEQLLRYIYTGKVGDLCVESASLLYQAADKYAVEQLKKYCASFIITNLSEINACDVILLADFHGDEDFKESVMCFMVREKTFLTTDQWDKFSEVHPSLAVKVYKKFVVK